MGGGGKWEKVEDGRQENVRDGRWQEMGEGGRRERAGDARRPGGSKYLMWLSGHAVVMVQTCEGTCWGRACQQSLEQTSEQGWVRVETVTGEGGRREKAGDGRMWDTGDDS